MLWMRRSTTIFYYIGKRVRQKIQHGNVDINVEQGGVIKWKKEDAWA